MKKEIIKCIENIGCSFEPDSSEIQIEDSIMFIAFIVELEEVFEFELPDEYLAFDRFKTIEKVAETITEIRSASVS